MTMHERVPNEREPASNVVRAAARPVTLSQRLWGLDWSTILPWRFDDVTLDAGSFDEALPFMQEHFPQIFADEHERFFAERMTEAKRRFGDEMDVFVWRDAGATIGVATAHPSDWSTYYIRTFAVLPQYRERGFCNDWTDRICAPLREVGCDRWEGECSPANAPMLRMLVRQGCLISGTVSSDRWGQMLRFTKFLNGDAEDVFRHQFLYVPAFGRDAKPK